MVGVLCFRDGFVVGIMGRVVGRVLEMGRFYFDYFCGVFLFLFFVDLKGVVLCIYFFFVEIYFVIVGFVVEM